ncbi:50S ribosomal protein L1 [Blattabacterium cuenoti]|uniref:50S ribosomal protein L1 n=1 Tax=Blattabacterium cuenoti TaxID=1653831 RepID=UPI00163CF352|nr:50S ribosomal protein L1 [Blattabacterium cuenoti]
MSKKLTKNKKSIKKIVDIIHSKKYSLEDALSILKKVSFVKFDESLDISVNLGINYKSSKEIIMGTVFLPHSTGKKVRILAFVSKDKESACMNAGADYVGMNYIEKIKSGWTDIDIIVTMPSIMNKLVVLGKILGPKGLIPNVKMDTISIVPENIIKEIKSGRIFFKMDKFGIIHSSVGRISFSNAYLSDNIKEFMKKIIRSKPNNSKGTYLKSIFLSTTMSCSVSIDTKSFF